jgi:hypothetical protein
VMYPLTSRIGSNGRRKLSRPAMSWCAWCNA